MGNNKKKLIFRIGEETVPAILGPEEYLDSPFADVLIEGKREFIRLWNQANNSGTVLKSGKERSADDNVHIKDTEFPNNILAFLGERGSGKTSSLLSLKRIVEKDPDNRDIRKMAADSVFLPIIEPVFFDKNHNLLDIFVGELYRNTKDMLSKWDGMQKSEREKLRKLQSTFAQVKNALIFLEKSREEELHEEQESLLCLSEGVNLVKLMGTLVENYLECAHKRVLVVSIDDIDLNIEEAYVMLEQIRKYLKVPKVVVLLAAKYEQLKNSIEVYLSERYDRILENTVSREEIRGMAERYLEKMLPIGHRISMPVMTDYSAYMLEIIERDKSEVSDGNKFDTVEFAVLSLIYRKCGYLFYNSDEGSSLIIPRNLRSLRQLVTMLYEMDDAELSEDIHARNKTMFRDYFLSQWMGMLSLKEREIALKIWNEGNPGMVNKLTVSLLKTFYRELEMIEDQLEEAQMNDDFYELAHVRLMEILDDSTRAENVSVGDVAAVLSFLRSVIVDDRRKLLIFYLTSFYSMRLYELYDEMTSQTDNNNFPLPSAGEGKLPKLRRSRVRALPDYFRVVGHGFFTKVGDMMMPVSILGKSREMIRIDGILVCKLISDVIGIYEHNKECLTQPEFILRLNLAEFFIVCVARGLDYGHSDYSPIDPDFWRDRDRVPGYFEPFDRSDKNMLFDVTSPFLNLIYPKFAYNRFDCRIYEIARKCEKSLLHRLYNSGRRYKEEDNILRDLMSRMAVRNMEVLDDLDLWLRQRKGTFIRANEVRELDCLVRFFDAFDSQGDGYKVKTYLKNDKNDSFHTIDFSPLTLLASILRSLTVNSDDSDSLKRVKKELSELFIQIMKQEGWIHKDTNYDAGEILAILRNSLEDNIPEKEKVINEIIRRQNIVSIRGLLLVEYLAEYKIYSKYLFTEFLDKEAGGAYRNMIARDLEKRCSAAQTGWMDAQKKVDNNQAQLNLMSNQSQELNRKIRRVETIISGNKDKISAIGQRLNMEEGNSRNRHVIIESAEKMAAEVEENLTALKENRNEMRTRLKMHGMLINLGEKRNGVKEGEAESKRGKDVETLRSEYQEMEKELEETDRKIMDLEKEKHRHLKNLENQRASIKREEEIIKNIKEEIRIVEKQNDEANMQLSFCKQEDMKISSKLKARRTELDDLKREARALKKVYENLDEERKRILNILGLEI